MSGHLDHGEPFKTYRFEFRRRLSDPAQDTERFVGVRGSGFNSGYYFLTFENDRTVAVPLRDRYVIISPEP